MARPRHYINHVGPGELGFFTTTALYFAQLFCREEMREAMTWLLLNHLLTSKATLHAFVVMKHHIHFVARMPQTQHGNEFVQELKRSSALTLKPLLLPEEVDQLKQQTGLNRHTFWKRSYRSVPIYTEALLEQRLPLVQRLSTGKARPHESKLPAKTRAPPKRIQATTNLDASVVPPPRFSPVGA